MDWTAISLGILGSLYIGEGPIETKCYPNMDALLARVSRALSYLPEGTSVTFSGVNLPDTMLADLRRSGRTFREKYVPDYRWPMFGGYLTIRESFADTIALVSFEDVYSCPYCGTVHALPGETVLPYTCQVNRSPLKLSKCGPLYMVQVEDLLKSGCTAFHIHTQWAQSFLVNGTLPRLVLRRLLNDWRNQP